MTETADSFEREAFIRLVAMVGLGRSPGGRMMEKNTHGEIAILSALFVEGRCTPSWLASYMHVTPGRVSTAIKRLQDKGLVMRVGDDSDRRSIVVELTDAGRTQVGWHMKNMERHIAWVFDQMGAWRARQFVELVGEFLTYTSLMPSDGGDLPTSAQIDKAFRGRDERIRRILPTIRKLLDAIPGELPQSKNNL